MTCLSTSPPASTSRSSPGAPADRGRRHEHGRPRRPDGARTDHAEADDELARVSALVWRTDRSCRVLSLLGGSRLLCQRRTAGVHRTRHPGRRPAGHALARRARAPGDRGRHLGQPDLRKGLGSGLSGQARLSLDRHLLRAGRPRTRPIRRPIRRKRSGESAACSDRHRGLRQPWRRPPGRELRRDDDQLGVASDQPRLGAGSAAGSSGSHPVRAARGWGRRGPGAHARQLRRRPG